MDRAAAALAAAAHAQLAAALSSLPPAPKRLYVDDELYCRATSSSPLLNLFTSADALRRAHAVSHVLPLSAAAAAAPPAAPASAVFLLRPSAAAARHVAAALAAGAGAAARSLVLVTPRRSRAVERVLTSSIATGVVRVAVLPLGFLPFDDGLVTLHWPRAFAQVVLEGNNAAILAAASALRALSDALDVSFDTIRTAGAAGAATVDEYLQVSGRKVHAVPAAPPELPPPSPAAGPAGDDRPVRSDESAAVAAEGGPSLAAPPPPFAGSGRRAPLFDGGVSVARVLAGAYSIEAAGGARGAGGDAPCAAPRGRKRPVTLVVLDRNVDVVTPLLIQWTYEGLLDEAVGLLRGNVMDVGADDFISEDAAGMLGADAPVLASPNESPPGRRVQKRLRREGDSVFGQLRDLNYWAAARLLGSVASSVQAYYDARPGRETAEIGQVKHYVRGLREVKSEHRSAAVHTAIAAEVSARTFEQAAFKRRFELEREMLEGNSASGRRLLVHDAVARNEPLPHVLRLVCLWSLTGGGVDPDAFEFLRREIIATYGLAVLALLGNLERAGLLTRSARVESAGGMPWSPFVKFGFGGGGGGGGDGAAAPPSGSGKSGSGGQEGASPASAPAAPVVGYSWQFVRAAMHLMTEFEPEKAGSDGVAGPFSGYVPLTVRLVEAGVSPSGWSKLPRIAAHTLLLPPGHTVGERSVSTGTIASDDGGAAPSPPASARAADSAEPADIDAVVLFVGGVSRAEASAVRVAAAKSGRKVLIAATDVCGANQFVTMT